MISIYRTSEKCFSPTLIAEYLRAPEENKMAFVGILSQWKLLIGPLVIQLAWYILKQLILPTPVSVKVVDIYLHFGE